MIVRKVEKCKTRKEKHKNMKKLLFNLKTDRCLLYFDEETKKYYLIDMENDDYLYIAKKEEMQKKIDELEKDIVLLNGGLML